MNHPRTDHSSHDGPSRSTDEVLALLEGELSRAERFRYLTVGLASLAVTAVTASLWATEPSLPLRTHLAFAGIVMLGTAWMATVAYVLTRRRPLYAADRVLATGMAVVATTSVGIASTVLGGVRGGILPGLTIGVMSATFVAASVGLHLRARRHRDALLERRRELTSPTSDAHARARQERDHPPGWRHQ